MSYLTDNNGVLEVPHDPKYDPDPRGFGAYCFHKMKEFSDQIAQINIDTNVSETYGEILSKSIRIAMKLKVMGIKDTDIISLCTDIHSETCLPFWGAIFSGIKVANLDPSLSFSDMKHLINLVTPKVIFSIPESVKNLEIVIKELNLDTKIVVFGETTAHIPFKQFLKPQNDEDKFEPKVPNNIFDDAIIFFSSGTTGLPKAVCSTHFGLLTTINHFKEVYNMKTVLYYTSPYWITNTLILTTSLLNGGKRILVKRFDASNVLKIVQDYKVTYSFLAPTLMYGVAFQPGITSETYDTSSLNSLMLGGGTSGTETIEKLRKLLPHTYCSQAYGLTDVTGIVSAFNPKTDAELIKNKIMSSGKLVADTICKIIDIETGEVLGKNKQGELVIKAKRVMSGYYKDPEKTAEQFDKDGFLHTGDVAYYDDDYCFYIVNRIKEMFKYKSWHIVPVELEEILLKHPAVKEVQVIGYPHEEDGDHPMAIIIPKEEVHVTENDVLQYFNEQVSDRKKLRGGIKFVKDFPKTATGKYSRIKLRSMVINNEI